MKISFKIKFSKKVETVSSTDLLQNFKTNFEKSGCDFVSEIKNNEIIVDNDIFYGIRLRNMFSIWRGVGSALLKIEKCDNSNFHRVNYTINFSRLAVFLIFGFIAFSLFMPEMYIINENLELLITFLIVYSIFTSVGLIQTIIPHRKLMIRTINHGKEYLGNYKWEEIIESKKYEELVEIVKGRSHLPNGVIKLARKELEKRKIMNNQKATTQK